jgi:facilitated trehalose transporter
MLPLAALGGGFVGGPLLEALGRKTTIVATAIPFMAGGLLVTFAQDAYTIYAGRGITGFCIGIVSLSLPVYLAEAIHPEVRGTLGLLPTSLGNAGVMLCYILGFWLDWSKLSLAGAVLPLPFLLLVCMIPETPRYSWNNISLLTHPSPSTNLYCNYTFGIIVVCTLLGVCHTPYRKIKYFVFRYLITQDKGAEARSALQWLRGEDADITNELADMETANVLAKKNRLKFKELFSLAYFKPLGISMGLMFAQQFSGINAVMFYSVSIFKVIYPEQNVFKNAIILE